MARSHVVVAVVLAVGVAPASAPTLPLSLELSARESDGILRRKPSSTSDLPGGPAAAIYTLAETNPAGRPAVAARTGWLAGAVWPQYQPR